jgi:hypothetical protein
LTRRGVNRAACPQREQGAARGAPGALVPCRTAERGAAKRPRRAQQAAQHRQRAMLKRPGLTRRGVNRAACPQREQGAAHGAPGALVPCRTAEKGAAKRPRRAQRAALHRQRAMLKRPGLTRRGVGTSAVRRLRSLRWQAVRILWHQSSRAGFCPLCIPMLACLRGSRLEPSTELNQE